MGFESITVFLLVCFLLLFLFLLFCHMQSRDLGNGKEARKPNPPQCFHVPCPPFLLTTKTAPMSNDSLGNCNAKET